ncbi:DUF6650 family protein [Jiella avicenniae]|uniref:Uncharacterized protein n=1 Tax=Jiella avicenniae TaxID=2907202 RepID=A0A9X1P5J4_9HYPH|nr:DUF6650 family protein [Jiella avicenniae]MCE7030923.1 hypothetical protein [Jiella avicenniae]
MIVKAKEMLRRITGFSIPIVGGGVQWNPPASDRDAVRKFLGFLEDRRALFNPFPAEVEDHVKDSIQQIRRQCVATIGELGEASPGSDHVKAIGAACRRFLDEPYPSFDDIFRQRRDPSFEREEWRWGLRYGTSPEAFFTALGELRAFVGIQLASLSALYDIDIKGDLARILPPDFEQM